MDCGEATSRIWHVASTSVSEKTQLERADGKVTGVIRGTEQLWTRVTKLIRILRKKELNEDTGKT